MKKIYFLLFISLISFNLSAVTYTTAQNGNWTSPTTWNPIGVPQPGDVAIINHDVVLNTDFAYTFGNIIVNSSGRLIEDATTRNLWLNGIGASFSNNGISTINRILVSNGTVSNVGILNVKIVANYASFYNTGTGTINNLDSLYNAATFSNKGDLNVMTFFNADSIYNSGLIKGLTTVVDSMFNDGVFFNDATGLLKADSCVNSVQFTNDGVVNFNEFTNTGIFTNNNYLSFDNLTNTANFTNTDSLIGSDSMTNAGNFDNQNGSIFNLGISFLNNDVLNNDANFNNDGTFTIGDSFFNFDTITGGSTGKITLQDSSVNYTNAYMLGSFEFCDLTPPATAPFIDFNLGTIDVNVTYCSITGITNGLEFTEIKIFPNPTTGILNVAIDEDETIEIYNVLGEQLVNTDLKVVDMTNYDNGLYILRVKNGQGEVVYQSKVIKH